MMRTFGCALLGWRQPQEMTTARAENEKETNTQTDRQTDRQADRQTHGNIDGRQIERLVLLAVCWWEKQDCLAAKACNAARHAAACGVT
jgi:hypothetical protein